MSLACQCMIAVCQRKNLLARTTENNPWYAGNAVEGKLKIMEIPMIDVVAEILDDALVIGFRQIENQTALIIGFMLIEQKIVDDSVFLGKNGSPSRGVRNEGLSLLRCKAPYTVDFFTLQDTAGKVVAQSAVGQAGELG